MKSNPFAEIALDGSLLLAAPIAVLAGLISFLSPCVLPLVPGYLGYVTGLGGDVLTSRRRGRLVVSRGGHHHLRPDAGGAQQGGHRAEPHQASHRLHAILRHAPVCRRRGQNKLAGLHFNMRN